MKKTGDICTSQYIVLFVLMSLVFVGFLFTGNTAVAQNISLNPDILKGQILQERRADPEPPSPLISADQENGAAFGQTLTASGSMAVTAHPLATAAAISMLEQGGSAADAAIAAQLVLGLVEPQSSGLGGGSFALYYQAETQSLLSLDGREAAPDAAGQDLFFQDGDKMGFEQAASGGLSVGVPGTPAILKELYTRFGKVPWQTLFDPALTLADSGFDVTPRLSFLITANSSKLASFPETAAYFLGGDGLPPLPGSLLKNPRYAATLRELRDQGIENFYHGSLGREIVAAIRTASLNPGLMRMVDLNRYHTVVRPNLCAPYRVFIVCSMGEPSSGGLTLLQILMLLEEFDLGQEPGAGALHLIAEASRLAFADRNFYMADPDFIETPGALLLSPDYIEKRRKLISSTGRITASALTYGVPAGWNTQPGAPDVRIRPPGTTHISVADSKGNVIAMTSSIEQAFGSGLMAGGFLLNNELTDFSFEAREDGRLIANRIEGGKRPRSSMAPVIIFRPDGTPFLTLGSAGGSRIIGYVLKAIVSIVDWKSLPAEALASRHFLARTPSVTEVEMQLLPDVFKKNHRIDKTILKSLEKLGHEVKLFPMNSGLTAIYFHDDGRLTGAADPRREGRAGTARK